MVSTRSGKLTSVSADEDTANSQRARLPTTPARSLRSKTTVPPVLEEQQHQDDQAPQADQINLPAKSILLLSPRLGRMAAAALTAVTSPRAGASANSGEGPKDKEVAAMPTVNDSMGQDQGPSVAMHAEDVPHACQEAAAVNMRQPRRLLPTLLAVGVAVALVLAAAAAAVHHAAPDRMPPAMREVFNAARAWCMHAGDLATQRGAVLGAACHKGAMRLHASAQQVVAAVQARLLGGGAAGEQPSGEL